MSTPVEGAARTTDLRAMLIEIVKGLVEHTDQVSAEEVQEGAEKVLYLKVAQSDVGRIIGKQGRTIRSLRTLIEAAGDKLNTRYGLEIEEEGEAQDGEAEGKQ